MESKFESKIGKITSTPEKIYNFLSDFRNFSSLIPHDKLKNWNAQENECTFSIEMIGNVGIQIIEKQPFVLIKITGIEGSKLDFFFWIQIKEVAPYDSRIKLTLKADLNPMVKMIASKQIQSMMDTLVDQIVKIPF